MLEVLSFSRGADHSHERHEFSQVLILLQTESDAEFRHIGVGNLWMSPRAKYGEEDHVGMYSFEGVEKRPVNLV